MYKPLSILAILLLASTRLYASENHPIGGRAIALSNAFVSISDTWSTFHNQAGIASFDHLSAGLFYESRYGIEELKLVAGTIILPTGKGSFAFSFLQFGHGSFKAHKYGLAYSRRLSKKLNTALQFDYLSQRFPENEQAKGFPTFEFGIIYSINKELTLGAHVFNPIQNGIAYQDTRQKMAATYRVGGHYLFSDHVLLSAEMEKKSDDRTVLKTGLEFSPVKNMAFRLGFGGYPVRYTTGLGYRFGNINTDFAFSYHSHLGLQLPFPFNSD